MFRFIKKETEDYRCPPYGYPPVNRGGDIPPIEEEKKDPPRWYLSS